MRWRMKSAIYNRAHSKFLRFKGLTNRERQRVAIKAKLIRKAWRKPAEPWRPLPLQQRTRAPNRAHHARYQAGTYVRLPRDPTAPMVSRWDWTHINAKLPSWNPVRLHIYDPTIRKDS